VQTLNLPPYEFKLKRTGDILQIFDFARKRHVALTPEEWVRQHVLNYLVHHKKYPVSLIAVEMQLKYHKLQKRADIAVYNTSGKIELLVECKAPEVKITQEIFEQIARYNFNFKSKYLMVSNGLQHYYCIYNNEINQYDFIEELPKYKL
jgi:hypothetical protein